MAKSAGRGANVRAQEGYRAGARCQLSYLMLLKNSQGSFVLWDNGGVGHVLEFSHAQPWQLEYPALGNSNYLKILCLGAGVIVHIRVRLLRLYTVDVFSVSNTQYGALSSPEIFLVQSQE